MSLENFLLKQPPVKVIDPDGPYCVLDLSVENVQASAIEGPDAFVDYVNKYKAVRNCSAAFGGYNEKRTLYKKSLIFNDPGFQERDIHIGVDIWINSGTPVLAALPGKVHSFNFNAGMGNYGPTIILKHQIEDNDFFTLYGHLSIESIEDIEIGDVYEKGQVLGTLGNPSVNGNYAPHLHFQIIKDIGDYFGDYPGVCSADDLDYFLSNCPDPNLLLKLN